MRGKAASSAHQSGARLTRATPPATPRPWASSDGSPYPRPTFTSNASRRVRLPAEGMVGGASLLNRFCTILFLMGWGARGCISVDVYGARARAHTHTTASACVCCLCVSPTPRVAVCVLDSPPPQVA